MIGWAGNVFIITGILAIAYRHRYGFILGCIGNSLWCLKGFMTNQYDLISISFIIVSLQVFSWINWGRTYVGATETISSESTGT